MNYIKFLGLLIVTNWIWFLNAEYNIKHYAKAVYENVYVREIANGMKEGLIPVVGTYQLVRDLENCGKNFLRQYSHILGYVITKTALCFVLQKYVHTRYLVIPLSLLELLFMLQKIKTEKNQMERDDVCPALY